VKAVSGAIPIAGKMPVSIPGHAAAGDGLEIPRLEMILKAAPNEIVNSLSNTSDNLRQVALYYIKSDIFSDVKIVVGHKGFLILHADYHKEHVSSDAENNSSGTSPHPSYNWGSGIFGTIFSAMLATESGGLLLDAPVQDYIPEQRDADLGKITVSDLLADIRGKSQTPPGKEISKRLLMDEIVSRATGLSFGQIISNLTHELAGERILGTDSYSINDVAVFSQALLNKGIYHHHRILKPDTIAIFTRLHKGTTQALGWMKPDPNNWTGRLFSRESFGLTDTEGNLLWIDPQKHFFIVLEANAIKQPEENIIEEAYEKMAQTLMDGIKNDNAKWQGR
jgi:hypothetical protein